MNLEAWLHRLEALHPAEIELGLDRVSQVARCLGCLSLPCPVITVAGTNGKGSTVAALNALSLQAGLRTCSYTSPHLIDFNERICLDGVPADDETLVDAFERVEAARGDVPLTYFEFSTLAALDLFVRQGPDLAILEVGLGGRLDAVNIVDPDVAVITSISLDHQDWLGSDLQQIAREKAGILRRDLPAVLVEEEPPASLLECCRELSCRVYRPSDTELGMLADGHLHARNLWGAWKALQLTGLLTEELQLESCASTLTSLQLPGRQQWASYHGRKLYLDVAHNPAAIERMVTVLQTAGSGKRTAVFAALSDKDIHAMIRSCRGLFESWHLAELPGVGRACKSGDVVALLEREGESLGSVSDSPAEALAAASSGLARGDTLAVFGSFHTVAAALQEIAVESQ